MEEGEKRGTRKEETSNVREIKTKKQEENKNKWRRRKRTEEEEERRKDRRKEGEKRGKELCSEEEGEETKERRKEGREGRESERNVLAHISEGQNEGNGKKRRKAVKERWKEGGRKWNVLTPGNEVQEDSGGGSVAKRSS